MHSADSVKFRNALWWITSIAISVVCCSVLFILFASYLADMKDQVKDTNIRITSIEARQDRLLLELEALARRGNGAIQPAAAAAPTPIPATGDVSGATVAVPVTPSAPEAEPAAAIPATPAAPQVTVPTMPENK